MGHRTLLFLEMHLVVPLALPIPCCQRCTVQLPELASQMPPFLPSTSLQPHLSPACCLGQPATSVLSNPDASCHEQHSAGAGPADLPADT